MTNAKINATVEEIMEYEALLEEVKGIVDNLKDSLKNLIPKNLKRFTNISILLFFVRHDQDAFRSAHNYNCFSLGSKNEPREESS